MGVVVLAVLLVLIVMGFFGGNIMIVEMIHSGETLYFDDDGLLVILAVVGDCILLYLAIAKIKTPFISSLRLLISGLKNRRKAKKEAANLKKLADREKHYVNRLQELRKKGISKSATKQALHFCRLMETLAGKEQLQDCFCKVNEMQSDLHEIEEIESEILHIAESYNIADNTEKCNYYLSLVKENKSAPEVASVEEKCLEYTILREKERNAIRSWRKVLLGIFICLAIGYALYYTYNAPYRELRSRIRDQSLTAEMCDEENMSRAESYYVYLHSSKGYKFLASELTQLHMDNDVGKAMWLLCIQPDFIDGYDVGASTSFMDWIIKYAKSNGVRSTDQKGVNDQWYNVTYEVDGYRITISSDEDRTSDINEIRDFFITDGENQSTICVRKSYNKTDAPIIE